MTHFAVALARAGQSWTGTELDLAEVEDVDGLVEVAVAAVPDGSETVLIAVEEDDEWLALVRVDSDPGDARVFLSDTRVLTTSGLAKIFADAIEGSPVPVDDVGVIRIGDDTDDGVILDAEPGGDAGLLADLGIPAGQLLAWCAEEGALPGDVTAAVCERVGAAEVYDALRTP